MTASTATSHLTPETATKLLLTRPYHRVTYTYARESRRSSQPYRVRCSCGWDAGWLRCTLPVALALAQSHVEPELAQSPATSPNPLSATTRPADPAPALSCHSASRGPVSSLLGPSQRKPAQNLAQNLPPCALDAASASALALDWLARGD
jgi:hypothetical protein